MKNPSIVAQVVLRLFGVFVDWLRSQPAKVRNAVYLVGLILVIILALAVLLTWLFMPELREPLKTLWLIVGPFALAIGSAFAKAHLNLNEASSDGLDSVEPEDSPNPA